MRKKTYNAYILNFNVFMGMDVFNSKDSVLSVSFISKFYHLTDSKNPKNPKEK